MEKHQQNKFNLALFLLLKIVLNIDCKDLQEAYQALQSKYIATRGKKEAIKHLKSLYGIATRLALRIPIEPLSFVKGKNGVPVELKLFESYLLGSNNERRAALTVLSQFRLLYIDVDPTIESITAVRQWIPGYDKFRSD
jgi:hypothetical protein